jgi:hypothetical protein
MTTAVELLYEYRHLVGKCSTGEGLDMDEIQVLHTIEGVFGHESASVVGGECSALITTLRGDGGKLCDEVQLFSVLLDQLILKGCPWVEAGSIIEVVIEDTELGLSYRFKGRVAWTRDDGEATLTMGLDLVGVPLLMRRGPRSQHQVHPQGAPAQGARQRRTLPRAA